MFEKIILQWDKVADARMLQLKESFNVYRKFYHFVTRERERGKV